MNLKEMRLRAVPQMLWPDAQQPRQLDLFPRQLLELRNLVCWCVGCIQILNLARHHGRLRLLDEGLRLDEKVEVTVLLRLNDVRQRSASADDREPRPRGLYNLFQNRPTLDGRVFGLFRDAIKLQQVG